jgi:Flp pilus assembly protein TadD
MKSFSLGLAVSVLLAAACQPTGGFPNAKGSPYAPSGRGTSANEVDALVVGHRLMQAGEFELALRAYYRAAGKYGPTAEILSAIGSADLRLGRLNQAELMLRRALEADQKSVPAWNNLGVVLMERGKTAEASRVFQTAFALDSGQSDEIRENLRLALAKIENADYSEDNNENFSLVRSGNGTYQLLTRN